MSMPTIELKPIDPINAVANILASVALLEAGVSHVLNAEGEAIEKAIELAEESTDITLAELSALDESVASVLTAVAELEQTVAEKVEALFDHEPRPRPNQPAAN